MGNSILVINCGSSSVKYAVVPNDPAKPRIAGLAERLGGNEARLKGIDTHGTPFSCSLEGANHLEAMRAILERLADQPLLAVGHRIVHGGERFTKAASITPAVLRAIESMTELAPLHNPANLVGVQATQALYPGLPQVAVFDTAFHQTLPPKAYRYAIPIRLYRQQGIRRYGFHGSSHAYVSQRVDSLSERSHGGWLIAHLGNGCSTCAVWQGKSVDTSMGLTPLEGVVMGTRSGDVDPGLHAHLGRLGWRLEAIDNLLNKQSGLLGLSGLSNDMRTLEQAASEHHEGATLAIDVFCYRLAKSLAALSCALPRLDGIAFTGGIGENASAVRTRVIESLPHFGLRLAGKANTNTVGGKEGRIDTGDAERPEIWVIPTDEEGRIAEETRRLLEKNQ
ncbi:acetate/propionate family kinase [Halomonas halocynthiae]|uniref:acetate/propionate family kinase n=1 Tax=Halomonas halocynthiae TaxID=176290 RepID=UPI0003F84B28|nr:acetate kinase [Halomonas halocynthiae]